MVENLEILGADNLVHGRIASQKVVVRLSHEFRPQVGTALYLHFPDTHLHFFDSQQGYRL